MKIERREFLKVLGSAAAVGGVTEPLHLFARAAPARAAPDAPAPANDLCFMSAREVVTLIQTRKVSAREVMAAHLKQISRVNPAINAIVAKVDDAKCLALAEEADQRMARGERVGPLHGIPWAFKDLEAAVGFPFTRGSPIYKDFVPTADSVIVERLRRAGAIAIGKTNVPEFGMGGHTYNKVYGTTVNPYDVTKSAGGSSGGAGAALAAGLLPLADGSDMGGSLRIPANFNNVVALRPTVGLVPLAPSPLPLLGFQAKGPMARSVADTSFLLSVMAGPDARDPASYPSDPARFKSSLSGASRGCGSRGAPDLGGFRQIAVSGWSWGRTKDLRGTGPHLRGGSPRSERARTSLSHDSQMEGLGHWGHCLKATGTTEPEATSEIEPERSQQWRSRQGDDPTRPAH